jgi:hypothetical protein
MVNMLPAWYDIDDVEGLRRLHRELRAARGGEPEIDAHTPHYPAATASLMRSLSPAALAGIQQESDPQIPLGSA